MASAVGCRAKSSEYVSIAKDWVAGYCDERGSQSRGTNSDEAAVRIGDISVDGRAGRQAAARKLSQAASPSSVFVQKCCRWVVEMEMEQGCLRATDCGVDRRRCSRGRRDGPCYLASTLRGEFHLLGAEAVGDGRGEQPKRPLPRRWRRCLCSRRISGRLQVS